ncbi:MAG TPA: hypothetical protein VFZ79_08855, partial [Acidimicrobiales bacterium]
MARWRVLAMAAVLLTAPAACTSGDDGSDPPRVSTPRDDAAAPGDEAVPDATAASCPEPGDDARPWEDGPAADLVTLSDGGDGPRVRAAVYPRPDYEGNPWSQWGQGAVLDDGRFLSAIGDHQGRDGNSYLYEYDPAEQRLVRIGDVASLAGHDEGDPWSQWGQGLVLPDGRFVSALGDHLGRDGNSYLYEYQPDTEQLVQIGDVASVAGHEEGDWGYGKVHAQMVAGPCGEVYAASYWGTRSDLELGGSYDGDVLLRLDPAQRTTTDLGTILEGHGVPSMAGWTEGGLIYAEAADPELFDPQRGAFVVIDMATGERVFATDDEEDHRGFRSM